MTTQYIHPQPLPLANEGGIESTVTYLPDSTVECRIGGSWLATCSPDNNTVFVAPSWSEQGSFAHLRAFISLVWGMPRHRVTKRAIKARMNAHATVSRW